MHFFYYYFQFFPNFFFLFSLSGPCLSFDVIRDKLGSGRTKFPMTAYLVAGTQADQSDKNEVLVMKVGDLHKTMREEDDDDDDVSWTWKNCLPKKY